MAGIGFTLRKVIARGEMGSTVQAALSGILIVAGPWILSIITLSIVNRYMGVMMAEASGLFIAQLVYTYSASLILFSPIHLLFTRLIADLIWEDRESEASRLLLWFCAFTGLLSLIIAIPAFLLMPLSGLGNPMLFRWGAILFFLFINLIWVILLFNSLLRWYGRILGFMSLGMAVSVGLIWLWGSSSGLAGAMMGFAVGHGVIVVLLLVLGLVSYPPVARGQGFREVWDYAKRYRQLIIAGTLANAAIWLDKIIYWFSRGSVVEGSIYRIFEGYDVAVYYANLIMVPGLAYFVIFGETGFYTYLRKFLITLTRGTYVQLQKTKFPDHRHCRVLPIVVGDHHQLPVLLRAVLAGHENRRTVPAVESSTHHLRRSAGGPGRSLMDPAAGNQHHTVGDHGLSLRLCKFRGEGPEYGSDHTHQVNSAAKS
jgi:uncharacterized membrane protein